LGVHRSGGGTLSGSGDATTDGSNRLEGAAGCVEDNNHPQGESVVKTKQTLLVAIGNLQFQEPVAGEMNRKEVVGAGRLELTVDDPVLGPIDKVLYISRDIGNSNAVWRAAGHSNMDKVLLHPVRVATAGETQVPGGTTLQRSP